MSFEKQVKAGAIILVAFGVLTSCATVSPATDTTALIASTSTVVMSPGTTDPQEGEETFTITDATGLIPESGPHLELIAEAVNAAIVNNYRFTEASLAYQQEVFADGEVTRSEYDRSKFAAADCMRNLGHTVLGPMQYGPDSGAAIYIGGDPRSFLYTFIESPGPASDDDGYLCQELWDFTIGHVWVGIHTPTGAEKQMWLQAAWDCARERKLPLSDPPTEREATDATAYGCEPWLALPPR